MNHNTTSLESQFEALPFRGRHLDSNYKAYCKCCDQSFRLWYGSANSDNRAKMESGKFLNTTLDCPPCKLKKGASDSAKVYYRMTVDESVKMLYIMGQGKHIDYDAAERQEYEEKVKDKELEEMEAKSDWYLSKHGIKL